ncbi:hypothetical protein [Gilvibacter sp.]|uniref:hypothetical protein n=1 Tax=Gilvibacter sp. TaxID=2729997 RepID=UPI0025C4B749|nr:hypothetical protein [Gilvibacter sp.]NQX78207.1 hypothetical protein [Gilvibacter sp.]
MRLLFFVASALLLMCSCDYFETKKIDSDTLFEQEMATINWAEVDQYPLFKACDETAAKAVQLECFHKELSNTISGVIRDSVPGVIQSLRDTVMLEMRIDTSGIFTLQQIKMDSMTRVHLPKVESWLKQALGQMDRIAPATKKGVPVVTQYTLPLILATD